MAAIRNSRLHLWPKGRSSGSNQTLGSVLITEIVGPWGADGGLRVGIEYQPPKDATDQRRLVELAPTIVSAWPTRRPCGWVRPLDDMPGGQVLLGENTATFWWLWHLTADEIEAIERERSPSAVAETVSFNLEVHGVAVIGAETWGFGGDTQFSLATSDWLGLMRSLGYSTPPSLQDLAGQSLTLAPSWTWAQDKIQDARRHLALGEDREALRTVYVVFDAVARNPYKSTWDEVLADSAMPPDKVAAIRALLTSHAAVLNKLGRHPSDDLIDGRDRQMLPLDHWEAELAVALSQLLLAAVERWRTIREAHGGEQSVPAPADERA
ncbi:MAG: hypothetical protein M0035_17325 [Actinomycetota bacterium]|nr:hypothetical protein [Actinomycetota bacterium]